MLDGIFQLYSNFNRTFYKQTAKNLIRRRILYRTFYKQTVGNLIRRRILVMHCFLMSHKKDTRLEWVYYIHDMLLQAVKALSSLCICTVRTEPSLVEKKRKNNIACASSNDVTDVCRFTLEPKLTR